MKIWQRLLMAAAGAVGKLVQSGFGTTVKGNNINQINGNDWAIAVKGRYRYLVGSSSLGTDDPIIGGITMNKDNGTRWIVRIGDQGQPLWIASMLPGAGNLDFATEVADNGDLIIATASATTTVYNSDGTVFTPSETLSGNCTIARLGSDGFWLWGRRLNVSIAINERRIASLASAGGYIAISVHRVAASNSLTYDGVTYSAGGSDIAGALLVIDGDSNYLGHTFAKVSGDPADGGPVTAKPDGTIRWLGRTAGANTRTLTVGGLTATIGANQIFIAELVVATGSSVKILNGTTFGLMTNLSDGGLAVMFTRGGSGTDDYGDGITLTRTNRITALVRFDATLTTQVARAMNTDGTAAVYQGGVVEDGTNLVLMHALQANDTIAGQSITATATNLAMVVHRVTKSTLSDVWVTWAENTTTDCGWGAVNRSTRPAIYTDNTGTCFVAPQVHSTGTVGALDLMLYPTAIGYARETQTYEVFCTISDAGVWETP